MTSGRLQLEILRILGSGGFGTVAVVRDRKSRVHYAAKVLREEHLANDKVLVRVRDEAGLLTRLQHPTIVRVLGLVQIAERPVVLMEWVRGASLDAVVHAGGCLTVADASTLVIQASDALHAVWEAPDPMQGQPLRVIHRDIKPANMLLTRDGALKLVDFGIARGQYVGREAVTNSMVLGTREYVAPERLDGGVDLPAGDVYALGVVLFELISGTRLQVSMFAEAHERTVRKQLERATLPGLDSWGRRALIQLLAAMCAYEPEHRPSHAEVSARLREILQRCGLQPSLDVLARRIVEPLLRAPVKDPRSHPVFPHIAFLEDPQGVAPSEVDDRVRAVLSKSGWVLQRRDLARLLADDPSWTAAPFGELLDARNPPKWMFWVDRLKPAELVTVLELVEPRADERVLRHAEVLQQHPDPVVSFVAERLLARHRPGA